MQERAAGEVVVRQRELAVDFYVVADGAVVFWRDGREVGRLGPADAFGEMG